MDFLKEWETKLAIKITCSQVILQAGCPIIPQHSVKPGLPLPSSCILREWVHDVQRRL